MYCSAMTLLLIRLIIISAMKRFMLSWDDGILRRVSLTPFASKDTT
jgi:hypothetical protein